MRRINFSNAIHVEKWSAQLTETIKLVKAERIKDTAWGVASSYKSCFIDSPAAQDFNNMIFGS
jgi:hypothetical protein